MNGNVAILLVLTALSLPVLVIGLDEQRVGTGKTRGLVQDPGLAGACARLASERLGLGRAAHVRAIRLRVASASLVEARHFKARLHQQLTGRAPNAESFPSLRERALAGEAMFFHDAELEIAFGANAPPHGARRVRCRSLSFERAEPEAFIPLDDAILLASGPVDLAGQPAGSPR